jgi:hypothetical protein
MFVPSASKIFVSKRDCLFKFSHRYAMLRWHLFFQITEECDVMRKLVVLTALALGALAVSSAAVAVSNQAAQACSKACMNCCY